MDRPSDSQRPPSTSSSSISKQELHDQVAAATAQDASTRQRPFSLSRSYLLRYNAFSAMFWAVILSRTVLTLIQGGTALDVYAQLCNWVKWTQTIAVLEVVHSLIGIVRAPVLTTAMQVASRLLLVWGIAAPFPALVASSPAYASMLFAWSTTEVIRYTYFAIQLSTGVVPEALLWLRYNTFFVLYPLGIASECMLVLRCISPAKDIADVFGYGLMAVLAIYPPGAYVLFTHMMKQRRKIMRGSKGSKSSAAQAQNKKKR